jgi:hypothetical protein
MAFTLPQFTDRDEQRKINEARDQRRDQYIDRFVSALSSQENERQAALKARREELATTAQLRGQGFDVTPEQVRQYLNPVETQEPSLIERASSGIKSLFSSEQPQVAQPAQPQQPQPDLFTQRTPEFEAKQQRQADSDQLRSLQIKKTQAELGDLEKPYLETKKGQEFVQKLEKQTEIKNSQQRKLSANDVLKVNEGAAIPKNLQDIEVLIAQNKDLFDPIRGNLNKLNPYDTRVQTVNANVKAVSQAFGRYMEGGVLRKEDEAKYLKMFPQIGDPPDIASNKLQIIQRLLGSKLQGDVSALKNSGFDVSGIQANVPVPEIPQTITQGAQKTAQPPKIDPKSLSRQQKIETLKQMGIQ